MSIASHIDEAIQQGNSITIEYVKYNGEISKRKISDLRYSDEFGDEYIEGYCHLREERRTFKISRIREVDGIRDGSSYNMNSKTKSAYNQNIVTHEVATPKLSQKGDFKIPQSTSNSFDRKVSKPASIPGNHQRITSPKPNNNKSEGCYIATMAYGDYNHPQVMILRQFRDERLLTNWGGRLFVQFYYWISPKLVCLLKNHVRVNSLIRQLLDSIVSRISGCRGEKI